MKITKPTEITMVPVDQINIGQRIRPLDPKAVDVLKQSVLEVGQITTPIHVRKTRDGYDLIDGRHRLEVATVLQHGDIAARVWTCTQEEARFLEGDANLTSANLAPLDMAVNLAERRRLFLRLHPEKAQYVAGAHGANGTATDIMSFAEMMGALLGVSERHVRRIVRLGESLTSDEVEALRSAPKQLAMADIAQISKIGEPDERQFVVRALASGEAKGVAKARKAFKGDTTPIVYPDDAAFSKLADHFGRANNAVKRRFVERFAKDLRKLLNEVE